MVRIIEFHPIQFHHCLISVAAPERKSRAEIVRHHTGKIVSSPVYVIIYERQFFHIRFGHDVWRLRAVGYRETARRDGDLLQLIDFVISKTPTRYDEAHRYT